MPLYNNEENIICVIKFSCSYINVIELRCLFDRTNRENDITNFNKKSYSEIRFAVVLSPFSSCFLSEFRENFDQLYV